MIIFHSKIEWVLLTPYIPPSFMKIGASTFSIVLLTDKEMAMKTKPLWWI